MRKIIYVAILLSPLSSFAKTCVDSGSVYDDLLCATRALDDSKRELNAIYQKIYASTQYKSEFEESQKAWLNYREKQCGGYIAAEASQSQGDGPGLIVKDCLVTITK
ncbi:lysozyme inhibitor LprI family protein [Paraburkholderia megapolitana]|uniref:lysozyme inhibitor LprI family protein n=1 Tax=Paraburkholderia megapolitana TaxID=420953 RepID=UPI0038BA5D01